MLRNENTAKVCETWINNSPPIIPRKMQMKPIKGEPKSQTKLREKQVIQNFQTEIELMKLRAESYEEKFKNIDSEMEELINKKSQRPKRRSCQETVEEGMCSRGT